MPLSGAPRPPGVPAGEVLGVRQWAPALPSLCDRHMPSRAQPTPARQPPSRSSGRRKAAGQCLRRRGLFCWGSGCTARSCRNPPRAVRTSHAAEGRPVPGHRERLAAGRAGADTAIDPLRCGLAHARAEALPAPALAPLQRPERPPTLCAGPRPAGADAPRPLLEPRPTAALAAAQLVAGDHRGSRQEFVLRAHTRPSAVRTLAMPRSP
jgi:hypothetical protein